MCLSGGGIRSASFCLGVAQGLARLGLLTRFQYLSTVSGGGYLGCLLAAWAYRAPGGMDEVQATLAADAPGSGTPVAWWREYLSYLAPRRGLLSLDTWTLMATYVRNLLLNALVWLPLIAIGLLLPHLIASIVDGVPVWLGATPSLDKGASMTMVYGVMMMVHGTVLLRSQVGRGDPIPGAPKVKIPQQLQHQRRLQ